VTAPVYDVENALRELARARRRQDQLTTSSAQIADDLAIHMARQFGPEGAEVAGLALVTCAASLGALRGLPVEVVMNVVAFAGQRMVLDARAAERDGYGRG
jgi:hypothetical protein